MNIIPVKYSILLFLIISVVQSALQLVFGTLTAAELIITWANSVVIVGMFNFGYLIRRRQGNPVNLDERDNEIMNNAMAAGFLTTLASAFVLLTYQGIQASVTPTLVWVLIPGIVVVLVVAGVLELRHRHTE
jgi:hypothetical protein